MSAQQLHATDGGMFMDKEDTMGAMKDGVSHQHPHLPNLDHYYLYQV